MIAADVTGTIGKTPLIRLQRTAPSTSAEIVAKFEACSPGGSVKDRAALSMIDAALASGQLRAGAEIVEASAGNTGVGLAMVAAARGFRCVIVLPAATSVEKVRVLRAFGAEVIFAAEGAAPDSDEGYIGLASRIARERRAFNPDQFENPANRAAHESNTAPEIFEGCDGSIDAFVACLGSGGSIAGVGRYLRERIARIRIVGAVAHPSGGRSESLVEGIVDDPDDCAGQGAEVDEVVGVSDEDAIRACVALARREGLLVGGSSGVAFVAALEVAARLGPGKRVVVLFPDTGRNYLSTFFDEGWRRGNGLSE